MATLIQSGSVLFGIAFPLCVAFALAALSRRFPAFQPWSSLLWLMSLVVGFLPLRRAFPRLAIVIGIIYFPLMVAATFYLGVVLAWRLFGLAF